MSRRLPSDAQPVRLRPFAPPLTAGGWLTREGLAFGHVQVRGDEESGMHLEHAHGGGYRVGGCGRWIRGEADSHHVTLGAARAAWATLDHEALSAQIAAAHFAGLRLPPSTC